MVIKHMQTDIIYMSTIITVYFRIGSEHR